MHKYNLRESFDLIFNYQYMADLGLPPFKNDNDSRIDDWWAEVDSTGKYAALTKLVKAVLSCFHGPQVESSFSVMGDIIDKRWTSSLFKQALGCIKSHILPFQMVLKCLNLPLKLTYEKPEIQNMSAAPRPSALFSLDFKTGHSHACGSNN